MRWKFAAKLSGKYNYLHFFSVFELKARCCFQILNGAPVLADDRQLAVEMKILAIELANDFRMASLDMGIEISTSFIDSMLRWKFDQEPDAVQLKSLISIACKIPSDPDYVASAVMANEKRLEDFLYMHLHSSPIPRLSRRWIPRIRTGRIDS